MKCKALFLVCCTVSLFTSAALAQETEVARKEVPAAVLSTFSKDYPHAKVLEWEKEIHGGKLYYEAETVEGKTVRNVLYTPDGTTAQVEEKIAPKDLPQAIVDAVKQQYPGATIRSAYKVIHLDVTEYAFTMSGASPSKLVVSTEGVVVSKEGKRALDRNP